jgi:N-acetyl-alpha-D-glucosaminyl L-malate synthase BshA
MRIAERGHDVHFICVERPVRLRGDERVGSNLHFHQAVGWDYPVFSQPPHELTLAAKMAEVAQEHDLDLLHVHYALPHATAAYIAKQILHGRKEIATVTTLHGTDITLVGMHPSIFDVTRFSIVVSDAVTTVSAWLEEKTRTIFHVDCPIRVIHNFVDGDHFRPLPGHPLRGRFAKEHEKIVMHASNFRAVKNVGAVIDAFAGIEERVPARLLMIGEGPERRVVEERARERKISERVLFLGNHEFIEQFLPLADLFLLPSWHESFGLVALEAMSAGVPVIATNVGGTREVIEHGVDGYLVAPDDVPRMVEIGTSVLTDAAAAAAVSENARKTALSRFSVTGIVDQYLALYREVLETPRPSSEKSRAPLASRRCE